MNTQDSELFRYEPVPIAALQLFRMSWQLESWLRDIVYVELRSSRQDWKASIERHVRNWPPSSLKSDKRLHHMSTSHEEELSYLTLGELWQVMSAPENWPLFADYMPPKDNVLARIDEVKTIRNRVAHCRLPHVNDERRLELFLRDLDPGLRRFCLRYTTPVAQRADDPVANEIASQWTRHGHATELFSDDIGWLYALEPYRGNPRLGGRLSRLCRTSSSSLDEGGTIYRLDVFGLREAQLDLVYMLEGALSWRDDIVHAIVVAENKLQVTIPSTLGTSRVVKIVGDLLQRGKDGSPRATLSAAMKRSWPECVLWPNHPLAMFVEEYDGMIFDLSPAR